MPGVTEDMLARVMAVDFDTMAGAVEGGGGAARRRRRARTSPAPAAPTSLALDGRAGISDDGELTAPGAFGNLPCGEGFIAPAFGEGTVVASSLAPLGLSEEPATLTVARGPDRRGRRRPRPAVHRAAAAPTASSGRNLAELGVGTNDRARLTGNVLEDEKILGTVHVAFGASAGIGGTVSVPIHLDVVVARREPRGRRPHACSTRGRYVLD